MTPIKALQAANVGMSPLTRVALHASGLTEITGGSGTGKSSVLEAFCYALVGTGSNGRPLPPSEKEGTDGAPKVAIRFADGSFLTRRGDDRSITANGATETFSSQARLADKIGLGLPNGAPRMLESEADEIRRQRGAVARAIMAPKAWAAMADRELGRPLRNLLQSILPAGDVRAVVTSMMADRGLALFREDASDLKGALEAQTAANTRRDKADGARNTVQGAIDRIARDPAPIDEKDVDAAKETIQDFDAWAKIGSAQRAGLMVRKADVEARLAVAAPAPVDPEWITKATRWAATEKAHVEYDSARERVRAAREAHEEKVALRASVRERRAALGERPADPAGEIRTKAPQVARALEQLESQARAPQREAAAVLERAKAAADRYAGEGSDRCPTCSQPWAKHAQAKQLAAETLAAATVAADRAAAVLRTSEASYAALVEELAALNARAAKVREWDALNAAIGSEPQVKEAPAEPTAPTEPRPPAGHLTWASATLANVATVAAEHKAWQTAHDRDAKLLEAVEAEIVALPTEGSTPSKPRPNDYAVANARTTVRNAENGETERARLAKERLDRAAELAGAVKAHEGSVAEAARVTALVDCVRRAPSEIVRMQIAALGDLGTVRIVFPPKETSTTPEIEVWITNTSGVSVPWDSASDGEFVRASLDLRMAIRRVAGLEWLPIFVDRANLWTGDWTVDHGPIVWLTSVPDQAFSVGAMFAEAA